MTEPRPYLDISPEAGARFFGAADEGPVVMLNLLRFREWADYSHAPQLEGGQGVTGAAAYARYMAGIEPLLVASGGELLFAGRAEAFLIGPAEIRWDFAMLVRQASKAAFLAFASDPEARCITQHRTAAICDSRLLPLWPATAPA